jgi:hypothetical protein
MDNPGGSKGCRVSFRFFLFVETIIIQNEKHHFCCPESANEVFFHWARDMYDNS